MTQGDRSLLLVGALGEDALRCVRDAAATVGVGTTAIGRCDEAPAALAAAAEPLAIVLQMDAEGAAQTFAHVRGQARLAQLPIFGVAPQRDDLAFTELFSWGGDDLVTLTAPPALLRRLRPLVARPPSRSDAKPRDRGALVAGSDRAHDERRVPVLRRNDVRERRAVRREHRSGYPVPPVVGAVIERSGRPRPKRRERRRRNRGTAKNVNGALQYRHGRGFRLGPRPSPRARAHAANADNAARARATSRPRTTRSSLSGKRPPC